MKTLNAFAKTRKINDLVSYSWRNIYREMLIDEGEKFMLTRILDRLGFIPKHQRATLENQIASKVEYISTLAERNEILKTKLAEARSKIVEKQGIIDKLNLDKQAVVNKLNSSERSEALKLKLAEARSKVAEKQTVIDTLNERLVTLKTKLK